MTSLCVCAEMSCLMEALQDKRVRLQPECKKRLQDRIDMWSYAAKVNVYPILNYNIFLIVVPKHNTRVMIQNLVCSLHKCCSTFMLLAKISSFG